MDPFHCVVNRFLSLCFDSGDLHTVLSVYIMEESVDEKGMEIGIEPRPINGKKTPQRAGLFWKKWDFRLFTVKFDDLLNIDPGDRNIDRGLDPEELSGDSVALDLEVWSRIGRSNP